MATYGTYGVGPTGQRTFNGYGIGGNKRVLGRQLLTPGGYQTPGFVPGNPSLPAAAQVGAQTPPWQPPMSSASPAYSGGALNTWRPATLNAAVDPNEAAYAAKRALGQAQSAAKLASRPVSMPGPSTFTATGAGAPWGVQRQANDSNYTALQGYYAQKAQSDQLAMMPPIQRAAAMASMGMGGNAGAGSNVSQLAAEYQSAMDKANAANDARYQDTLAGSQARYDRNMGYLNGAGQQQSKDINQQFDQQQANTNNDLINRGLRSSTIVGNMGLQNQVERQNAQGRLQDQLRQQRISTDAALSGDTLGIMERKVDQGPDYNQLAQLAQLQGTAGPQGGGYILPPVMAGGGGGGYAGGGGGWMGPLTSNQGGGGSYNYAAAQNIYRQKNAALAKQRNASAVGADLAAITGYEPDAGGNPWNSVAADAGGSYGGQMSADQYQRWLQQKQWDKSMVSNAGYF